MCATLCDGHGVAIYVATPASPPAGLLWVAYASAAALYLLNVVLLRGLRLTGWQWAIFAPIAAIGLPAHALLTHGRNRAECSTAPEPGLAWGGRPFLGMEWKWIRDLFIEWNIFGLWLLLLGIAGVLFLTRFERRHWCRALLWAGALLFFGWWLTSNFYGGLWTWLTVLTLVGGCAALWSHPRLLVSWRFWTVLLANTVLYGLCLLPFFAHRTYAAGWTGNYVKRSCERQVAHLACALVRYTEEHDGRLPKARTMSDLVPQLQRYFDDHRTWFTQPLHICPTEYLYERKPQPYRWNPKLSGLTMSDLRNSLYWDEPVLSCPHHELAPELPLLSAFDFREGRGCPLVRLHLESLQERLGRP